MKKQVKKLTLRQEMLTDLQHGLGQVAGGTTTTTSPAPTTGPAPDWSVGHGNGE